MRTRFSVREKSYDLVLEKRERAEADKFHPFTATVSQNSGGPVGGTLQFTPEALEAAQKAASQKGGSADILLAEA
ncbi:MAG: hypothetical protein ACRD21_28280, partial [Vicinamibacteria bacterium]